MRNRSRYSRRTRGSPQGLALSIPSLTPNTFFRLSVLCIQFAKCIQYSSVIFVSCTYVWPDVTYTPQSMNGQCVRLLLYPTSMKRSWSAHGEGPSQNRLKYGCFNFHARFTPPSGCSKAQSPRYLRKCPSIYPGTSLSPDWRLEMHPFLSKHYLPRQVALIHSNLQRFPATRSQLHPLRSGMNSKLENQRCFAG
ncbi:hypothetical protein DFP72DRAFT_503899 [Ephemerocybe angulata]|uniref:Uncharacterized protein n=1 Tax=Ephemerocybe angulata TaxID=980116 RepID=A0A8H6HQB0_9AGAR|nr:hypothetical protein DFP72DRAFT_503899 [Tulosesus angulatus]